MSTPPNVSYAYFEYIAWVGVVWQRRCETRQSLRELDDMGTYRFSFLAVATTGGRVRLFVRGEPLLRTRGMIGSRSGYGKAPMRQLQLHSMYTIAVSGSGYIGKQFNSFDAVIICKKVRLTSGSEWDAAHPHATCRTPHGASRLVLAMSAWSVKTRRAPFRHCRDARVLMH